MKQLKIFQFLSIFFTPVMLFIYRGFELYLPSILFEKFGFIWIIWGLLTQPLIWLYCFLCLEKAIEQKKLEVVKSLRIFRLLSIFFTPIMFFVYSGFELYLPSIVKSDFLDAWFAWHLGTQFLIWFCCFTCFEANTDLLLEQKRQKLNESMLRLLKK